MNNDATAHGVWYSTAQFTSILSIEMKWLR